MDSLSFSEWLPFITPDWLILGGLVALVGIDSLRSGSRRAAALALAVPIAVLLHTLIGSAWGIGELVAPREAMGTAIVFVVLAFLLYLAFTRFTDSYDGGSFLHAFLVGVATAAVIIVSWLSVPSLLEFWQPNAVITALFGETYRFWWLLAGLATLSFVRK